MCHGLAFVGCVGHDLDKSEHKVTFLCEVKAVRNNLMKRNGLDKALMISSCWYMLLADKSMFQLYNGESFGKG